jgi:hypothetical protein
MNPLPACAQALPSTDHLCEAPQLACLAVLQAALRITGQVLDIQHPEIGSLRVLMAAGDTDSILAQLIIDRCLELSELLTCYRLALHSPPGRPAAFDDDPF